MTGRHSLGMDQASGVDAESLADTIPDGNKVVRQQKVSLIRKSDGGGTVGCRGVALWWGQW